MTNIINPETIQKYLKKFVVGQDEFIKALSSVAWIHQVNVDRKEKGLPAINNNTLVIGPSGCGKTYSIKKLAEVLNVPFIEIDGSKLQGNNYRGCMHVYDIFNSFIGSIEQEELERAIVFIDEFDKTLDVYEYKTHGSRHVQRDLLKVFEQGDVTNERGCTVDLSSVTFICAGSFYETIDGGGIAETKMGFGNNNNSMEKVYEEITADDLIDLGHLPELIGRFARIITLNMLSKEDITGILKKNDSLLSSFISIANSMNVDITVNDNYYSYLANNCCIEKMGFRSVNKLISSSIDELILLINMKGTSSINIDYKDNNIVYSCYDANNKLINKKIVEINKKKSIKTKRNVVSKQYLELA